MKWLVILTVAMFVVCSVTYDAISQCPDNQYYDKRFKRCVTPGDDPSGKVDRDFRRRLMDEGQGYCVDGYCCPDEPSFEKCKNFLWQKRWDCLKKNGCFKYGE